MKTEIRKVVTPADIEPGSALDGKVVESWHVSDTSHTWWSFGRRYEYVSVEFTDGSSMYATLERK